MRYKSPLVIGRDGVFVRPRPCLRCDVTITMQQTMRIRRFMRKKSNPSKGRAIAAYHGV